MLHNRNVYLMEVSLEEAQQRLRALLEDAGRWEPLPGEAVSLENALGRITAAPVWARFSSPHYHACAMDGYAVRAADTAGASDAKPVRLKLGEQAEAVDTGDPLPAWADAVVMVEHAELEGEVIALRAALARWQHVRSVGEDIVATELILPANHTLRPVDLGAIAGAGHITVNVRRRPRVVVIPTGDELIPRGQEPNLATLLSTTAWSWARRCRRGVERRCGTPLCLTSPTLLLRLCAKRPRKRI